MWVLRKIELYFKIKKIFKITEKAIIKLFDTEGTLPGEPLAFDIVNSRTLRDGLLGLIIIRHAASMIIRSEPYVTNSGMRPLLEEIRQKEQYLFKNNALKMAFEAEKIKTDEHLSLLRKYFQSSKTAFNIDPNSIEGIKYYLENKLKRPFTLHECKNIFPGCDSLVDLPSYRMS